MCWRWSFPENQDKPGCGDCARQQLWPVAVLLQSRPLRALRIAGLFGGAQREVACLVIFCCCSESLKYASSSGPQGIFEFGLVRAGGGMMGGGAREPVRSCLFLNSLSKL